MFGFQAFRGISSSILRSSKNLAQPKTYQFSTSVSAVTWQHKQAQHQKRQITSLLSRNLPINPTTFALMNLREMLLKAKEQCSLQELAISEGMISLILNDDIVCGRSWVRSIQGNFQDLMKQKRLGIIPLILRLSQVSSFYFSQVFARQFRWNSIGTPKCHQIYPMYKYNGSNLAKRATKSQIKK